MSEDVIEKERRDKMCLRKLRSHIETLRGQESVLFYKKEKIEEKIHYIQYQINDLEIVHFRLEDKINGQ